MDEERNCSVPTGDEGMAVALATASRYADVVVKKWIASLFKKTTDELFPNDPPIDFIGDVKFEPTNGSRAFTLKLAVVDSNYSFVATDSEVKEKIAMLLKAAHTFIRAVVARHMPDQGWIAPLPSPWSTIYIPGLPPDVPHIGVVRTFL